MRKTLIAICLPAALMASAQTNSYIKLNDKDGKHPRVLSITYPGNADVLEMYNSIYGHGAVIENRWLAYRVYMDNRQSLDLYVKHTPRLELDQTGFYTTPRQLADGYGCDVLWAGKSIGAGSFRGWQNNTPVTIDTVASRTQTVIADDCIEVIDREWSYNGRKIDMTQRYTISADSRELYVVISIDGATDKDLFCTGVQKLESNSTGFIDSQGAASWGENVPDKAHPELTETVGLGIIVDPRNIVECIETDLDYIFIVRPDRNGNIRYRVFGAGSREKDGFKTSGDWFDYIKGQISAKQAHTLN